MGGGGDFLILLTQGEAGAQDAANHGDLKGVSDVVNVTTTQVLLPIFRHEIVHLKMTIFYEQ